MHSFKTLKKFLLAVTCASASMTAMGQDLLADVAPVDHKLRAIDSLSIVRLTQAEESFAMPGEDLYPSWDNTSTTYGVKLPVNFRIDLRGFAMPASSRMVTSHYGYRRQFRRMHYGTDIKVYTGDTIYAAFSGKVRIAKYNRGGYGYYILIRHANGLETLYGHLSKQLVKENQTIKAGQPIGLGGNTGRSYGSHLHFETRFLGQFIDPERIFNFEAADVRNDYYVYAPNGSQRAFASNDESFSGEEDVPSEFALEPQNDTRKAPESVPEKKAKTTGKVHKVKKGDSLYGIARKYGTTVSKLCSLNHMKENAKLHPGQIIRCN